VNRRAEVTDDVSSTSHNIEVRRTVHRGAGVFATASFAPGDFILAVRGRLTDQQTQHSYQVSHTRHLIPDDPAGFLNHACVPNAGLRNADEGGYDVIAREAIPAGTEITIDYAMTEYAHYPRRDPSDEFDLGCRCASARCRGRLGYWSELPEDVKAEYRRTGMVARYLLADETTG
jgi:SET domain-containing protein